MIKLPFGWLPGTWGLKGKTREIAKAEYELEGYELDRKLAELNNDDPVKRSVEITKIDAKHNKISQYDCDISIAEKTLTGVDLAVRKLEIDLDHGKIDERQFAKDSATARGEPYIAVVESEYRPEDDISGLYFEFDWNEKWIETLIQHGYTGFNEEQIVQEWFKDLCRSVILEDAQTQPVPFNSSRVINRSVGPDGTTGYR